MNPFFDVCKKRASQWAIFLPRDVVGLIYVLNLSNLIISVWITPFFSAQSCFKCGQSIYWNGNSAFMLMPCDSNHSCVSTYQRLLSWCSTSSFDDVTANFEYLCLETCVYFCLAFLLCFTSKIKIDKKKKQKMGSKEGK